MECPGWCEEHKRLGSSRCSPDESPVPRPRTGLQDQHTREPFGVLSATHGRPPALVQGRPCRFLLERAERSSEAGDVARSLGRGGREPQER